MNCKHEKIGRTMSGYICSDCQTLVGSQFVIEQLQEENQKLKTELQILKQQIECDEIGRE